MSLLFSIISRENIVLCKYADCIGNFTEVTENLISNILLTNHKMTYTHGSFLFHYICEDRMIYMCISDENFPRARAFHFLSEIKLKFLSTYGLTAATAPANAMNKEFARVMALEMRKCNDKSEYDNLTRAEEEIAEIKGIMVKNIEKVVARGEQLDLLVIKSADLSDSASTFVQSSRNLSRALHWKAIKMYIFMGFFFLFITYIITCICCGGLTWQKCFQ